MYPQIETLEAISRVVEKIIKIQDETGENRVIFDARGLESTSSIWGIFERSDLVARMVRGKGFRVAALFGKHVPEKETQFMEDMTRNRGMELTVHLDEASALRWLGDESQGGNN